MTQTSPLERTDPIRVLLVEDNPGDVRLILEQLRSLPAELFDLERVDRLQSALERLRKTGIDVVLLDLGLPDCSGLETFHRMHSDAPDQPVLVISGLDDEGVALEAVRAGAQDYLVKGRMEGALLTRAIRYAIARKRSDAALAEKEAHYRSILQHVANAVYVSDPHTGLAQYVNPAYEQLFEQSAEHAQLTPDAWAERVHPDDRELLFRAKREGLQGRPFPPIVFRILRLDGSVRWIRGRATPVRDQAQRVIRVVGISEDITELKRTEEQFFEAQKMEAVGRLAGGVAHDFNNVLTAILGYADVLDDTLAAGDDRHEDVSEIRLAAQRAAGLTRQLLTFSRHQVLELRVLSPNTALANLEKMLGRLIGEDISLVMHLDPDAGNIKADTVQLEQVIINLAVNARDAMPHGGTITITTERAVLHEEQDESPQPIPPGTYVVLRVSDTGEGIPPAIISRVFEPFFTTKEKGRGTGLGLSTVYGIVRQSEGYIGIDSTLGNGTTFRIYLPVVDVSTEPEQPLTEPPISLVGKETILLAEDEAQLRRLYTALLQKMGYHVLDTANAADALRLAGEYKGAVDLLITDVIMPEISGPELARRLDESGIRVPVLFISGYTSDAIMRHGILRPGVNYLQKPFAPIDLARRVRQLLNARLSGAPRS